MMTKALVLDLWRVWHGMPPRERVVAAEAMEMVQIDA